MSKWYFVSIPLSKSDWVLYYLTVFLERLNSHTLSTFDVSVHVFLFQKFDAYKAHTNKLLQQERELNAKLRHLTT